MDNFKVRDNRKKDFFIIDNEVILLKAKEIGTTALAVYITLVYHSDRNQESFPSQDTIAEELGISRDTVIEKIKVLEQQNMISITQTRAEGTGKFLHNIYTLLDFTVWRNSDMDHVGKNTIRVEADTVSGNSDTNNTHVLTTPIEKGQDKLFQTPNRKERQKIRNFHQPSGDRPLKEFPEKGGYINAKNVI